MGKPHDQDHVLLQPRMIAAVGFIALASLGISLMLARILIIPGLLISLASAAGIVWIYEKPLLASYRAISSRIPYRGPPLTELLIVMAMVIILVIISTSVFSIVLIQEPPAGHASLELSGPAFVKIPRSAATGFINFTLRNTGSLTAENLNILMRGHLVTSLIDTSKLKDELSSMQAAFDVLDRKRAAVMHPQIQPGSGAVITLEDTEPDRLVKLMLETTPKYDTAFQVTDAQWSDF
jgi:hypothetical protein